MKYEIEILEMAIIACASIPDDLCEQMDISADSFTKIIDYIQRELEDDITDNTGLL